MRRSRDLNQAIRQALRIAPLDGDEHVGHAPPDVGREVPDLAEIDDGERPVVLDQQIARMRVGVIHAALERRLQHEAGDAARDHRAPPGRQVGDIGRLASPDTLFREHPSLGVLVNHLWNCESPFVREYRAKQLAVRRLVTIVELRP